MIFLIDWFWGTSVMSSFQGFHPKVKNWFKSALGSPTEIQQRAWPLIKNGQHTLISAPTGSGKTLAAFLGVIDNLVQLADQNELLDQNYVVYISPLKALSNDIHRNLQVPLAGIKERFKKKDVDLRVAVRTGDTPSSQRSNMYRTPPHILVTTPESLYLLLTSVNGRKLLSTTQTLIVDEIHAILESKRGSHLALSMERLQALTQSKLTRVGLSATQKPIETVAKFLTGPTPCTIIDAGHKRESDLAIELTNSPLEAIMSNEVWVEVYQRLVDLILSHETTLIFVNTRRLAERLTHHLTQLLPENTITAHHGSMSKEHRLDAEQKLKSGQLRALVATASMELGIDVGTIDLVCQIGSPNTIANFLQRVGRSGHSISGTPKGRLFPLSRDELVEAVALMKAIEEGKLDLLEVPEKPLDIMAQQIVAEVANQEYHLDDLYQMITRAYPYRDLEREEFDEIIDMLSNGFALRQGRRSAYLFQDAVNEKVSARRGARLTAIMSGGAIPDNFDVDVILEPSGTFVGTLNEDFALESLPGHIFQLGNSSYRVLRLETGKMKVEDAHGQPPNIPFWLGEAPGRSWELSEAVSEFRKDLMARLGDPKDWTLQTEGHEWKKEALAWMQEDLKVPLAAADQIIDYLGAGYAALGVLPNHQDIVLERFFDEAGDQHLIVHAPFGSKVNQAWGLALRKKFCRRFNFELQAAANEDAIILSLGATHSFQLDEVYSYLNTKSLRQVLIQALLDAPMFEIRWRWNATAALAVPRRRAGSRVPPQLQRMQSEDLVALIFPDQLACLENIAGEREVPDHPLVRQTIEDCLTDALDLERLTGIIDDIRNNKLGLHAIDLKEPSLLSQEIINSKPYTFIDDTPFEERRTLAINQRRWIDPAEARNMGTLDPVAIQQVKEEAWIQADNLNELHDGLMLAGYVTDSEVASSQQPWSAMLAELQQQGRVYPIHFDHGNMWVAVERLSHIRSIHPDRVESDWVIPEKFTQTYQREEAIEHLLRARLEVLGPVLAEGLAHSLHIGIDETAYALTALEQQGFVFRGHFRQDDQEEWCERRLLARIHRYTIRKLRSEVAPVNAADFMRYLFDWQSVAPGSKLEGPQAVDAVLSQLEGFDLPAASWERDVLPARIKDYDYLWLDVHCLSGNYLWGRFYNPSQSKTPIKTTPISLVSRSKLPLWQRLWSQKDQAELGNAANEVHQYLIKQGASFFNQMVSDLGLLKVQVEEGLSELVSLGLATADSFTGLRALLVPERLKITHGRRRARTTFRMEEAGRWSLITPTAASKTEIEQEQLIELAMVLLHRYGVIFRKLVDREKSMPPWRELVGVFRLLEARGEIRGGRFVTGVWGEQFALKEGLTKLRSISKLPKEGQLISISAADPLNLTGIITPGNRISAQMKNRVLYLDGAPVAVKVGKEVEFLQTPDQADTWKWRHALTQRDIPPKLKSYLGKGIY